MSEIMEEKAYTKDSQRTRHPSETVALVKERLKLLPPDVFLGLEEIGHLDTMGLPVYRVACSKRANEWGKGASIAQCQASAIMERVERYSAMASSHDLKGIKRASFNELENAISRNAFGLTNLHRIFYGEKKIDEMPMDWTQATSLVDGKKRWVPAQLAYFRYPLEIFWDATCTTGLASGNTREEAILHALCEVIERHQLHVNVFNKPEVRRVDLASAKNPALREVLSNLQKKGFVIVANDLSGTWKLSTVSALIFHPNEHLPDFDHYFHLGTSSDPEIALLRAITEAAQYRAIYRFNGGQILPGNNFFHKATKKTREIHQWIIQDSDMIPLNALTNTSGLPAETNSVIQDIHEQGYDMLWYDLTHSTLKIPVVRILIPGLQPNFLMHGYHPYDKRAIITPHLSIYDLVMRRCKDRQMMNQKLDEIVAL